MVYDNIDCYAVDTPSDYTTNRFWCFNCCDMNPWTHYHNSINTAVSSSSAWFSINLHLTRQINGNLKTDEFQIYGKFDIICKSKYFSLKPWLLPMLNIIGYGQNSNWHCMTAPCGSNYRLRLTEPAYCEYDLKYSSWCMNKKLNPKEYHWYDIMINPTLYILGFVTVWYKLLKGWHKAKWNLYETCHKTSHVLVVPLFENNPNRW